MASEVELLRHVYARFNARDMETVLAAMREDVMWANGLEGGHVHGRDGVRDYWTRQWAILDPRVDPVKLTPGPDGEVTVDVHQVVHDLEGKLLVDQRVVHIFRFEDGLIKRFDIGEAALNVSGLKRA
jgi:ketosteroid isomerase-like protein